MSKSLCTDQAFNGNDFSQDPLPQGEYESCVFSNCIFTNVDLSDYTFSDCSFEHCDLSMAQLNGTAFRDVAFKSCKLLGLRFDDCNTFSMALKFDSCVLNFASFFQLKLKYTAFVNCKLEAADFVEADLNGADFSGADLSEAVFENTILENADLRSAYNFSIDPERNRVAKARFSAQNVSGLLGRYKIFIE